MLFINELINKKFNTSKGYLYLVDLIRSKYPTLKINENNLKELSIVEMSQEYFHRTGFVGIYIASRNEIQILNEIETADYKITPDEIIETFTHELVHALTTEMTTEVILDGLNLRRHTGESSYFLALNEGVTQYIVNNLLGEKSDAYPFETNIALQLANIVGIEKLVEYYSRHKIEALLKTLKSIDKDFDERSSVLNMSAISKVLLGELENGQELEDKTRVTEIQKQLLSLHLKSGTSNDKAFLELMLDENKAEEILKQSIAFVNNPYLSIVDVGFMKINDIKEIYAEKLKEGESKMEYEVYANKKEELLANAQRSANDMVERIRNGQVISDVIDDEGERIIVTLTDRGTYGYQVFERLETEPHYYAEGFTLISDLRKTTDSDGRALRYTSAKSRVQRNLTGMFMEYILDRGHEAYYINQKCAKDDNLQVAQRMAGYDRQDPVVLFGAKFRSKDLYIAGDAQVIEEGNRHTIRIGTVQIKDDGTINYDLQFKMAMEAEIAKKAFGESSMQSERLATVLEQASMDAQSLLYPVYKGLGIPMMDGVEPNYLLFEQAKALLPQTEDDTNKLN